MVHVYHEALAGYHADQILHDGCPECEDRGKGLAIFLRHADQNTFVKACARAIQMHTQGVEHLSICESKILDDLGTILVRVKQQPWVLDIYDH